MEVIAEAIFDLANRSEKVTLRIFKPYLDEEFNGWSCIFEFSPPMKLSQSIHGESSLQALVLAVKMAASHLYGSDFYRAGQLGVFGDFGGDLSIPAPSLFLDIAPYPF